MNVFVTHSLTKIFFCLESSKITVRFVEKYRINVLVITIFTLKVFFVNQRIMLCRIADIACSSVRFLSVYSFQACQYILSVCIFVSSFIICQVPRFYIDSLFFLCIFITIYLLPFHYVNNFDRFLVLAPVGINYGFIYSFFF